MSTTDNWIKLYRWWEEHLKSRFISSSMDIDRNQLHRRPSLIPLRPTNNSQLINIKKRASYSGIEERQFSNSDFRHVRDSVRGKNSRTTRMTPTITYNKRRQFRKSTTCDISSEEILPKLTSMNRKHQNSSRRFSLVKLEPTVGDSNGIKNEQKATILSTSPNLIQKLLFRQFSPKTRPYSAGISSDENASSTTTTPNGTPTHRRATGATTTKQSWIASPSSTIAKQNISEGGLLAPKTIVLKSQQSELNSYLSRRRNTTGSISSNKIVDLKNIANGNTLKLPAAVTTFNNSNNKISTENIFQTIEDLDLLATKQLIHTNENTVNSFNEYDWCPLDIAIMLNNIPMIKLLLNYGGEESSKIQPEESRYRSVCQQLSILTEQNSNESIKKSSPNKLAPDDVQLRRSSPSCDKQQRSRRPIKSQQQLNEQRTLTLSQMKDNYEQAGRNNK